MDVVQADETGQSTPEPGKNSLRMGWMWTVVDAQAILFAYQSGRRGRQRDPSGLEGRIVCRRSLGRWRRQHARRSPARWVLESCASQDRPCQKVRRCVVDGLLIDIGVLFWVEETTMDEGYGGTDRPSAAMAAIGEKLGAASFSSLARACCMGSSPTRPMGMTSPCSCARRSRHRCSRTAQWCSS
jgi:hypothetical protein